MGSPLWSPPGSLLGLVDGVAALVLAGRTGSGAGLVGVGALVDPAVHAVPAGPVLAAPTGSPAVPPDPEPLVAAARAAAARRAARASCSARISARTRAEPAVEWSSCACRRSNCAVSVDVLGTGRAISAAGSTATVDLVDVAAAGAAGTLPCPLDPH